LRCVQARLGTGYTALDVFALLLEQLADQIAQAVTITAGAII